MNLSPDWVRALEAHGHPAIHWSSVGNGRAPDREVLGWARDNGCVLFTNDLDFGAILAATRATGPSVIQVRTQDVSPERLIEFLVRPSANTMRSSSRALSSPSMRLASVHASSL